MEAATEGTEVNTKRDIYVSNLPKDVDDAKLREIFSPYGEVTWVRALQREGRVNGLVEFATAEQATWVVQNMRGSVPQGLTDPIFVKYKDDPHERWAAKGKGLGGWPSLDALSGGFGEEECGKGGLFSGSVKGAGKGAPERVPVTVLPPKAGGKGGPPLPEVDPTPSDNVYLRNLPLDFTEERLRQIFGTFGTITQCKMMLGQTRHSALVRFSSIEEATTVVTSLKGVPPPGITELIEARYAENHQTKPQRYAGDGTPFGIDTIVKGFQMSGLMPGGTGYGGHSDSALYIAGLPPDTTDYYLYRLFSPLGAIAPKGVRTMTNDDGTCKGIAFVNYLDPQSAQMAISIYNGTIMSDGTRLKVAIKVQKQPVLVNPPTLVPAPVKVVPPPAAGEYAGSVGMAPQVISSQAEMPAAGPVEVVPETEPAAEPLTELATGPAGEPATAPQAV